MSACALRCVMNYGSVQVLSSSASSILRFQYRAVASLRSPARLAACPARHLQLKLVAAYNRGLQAVPADTSCADHPSNSRLAIPFQYREWSGLQVWRLSEVDTRRLWGEKGPVSVVCLRFKQNVLHARMVTNDQPAGSSSRLLPGTLSSCICHKGDQ